jgi:phycocyanin beta chain
MIDVFSKVVSEAEARGAFLSNAQLDALNATVAQGAARIEIINRITGNASAIVANAARVLFAEQPQLLVPGGSAYTTRRVSACLRDMEILLRYITYAMFVGDSSVLEDRCLNGLRETYLSLGVPGASVARSIQIMKEVALALLTDAKGEKKEIPQDLEVLIIHKLYPKQWVTIEVTEFKDGFPSRGKVLFYDSNIDRLSNKIAHLDGDVYTFFTGRIDDKPDPSFKRESNERNSEVTSKFFNLPSEYPGLLSELSSYFDRAKLLVI